MLGVHHRAAAVGQFALHIVQQHRLALCGVILFLQTVFPFRFIGQETVGPHLTMRVRVGAAHRCPFVFKNLHPRVAFPEVRGLFLPRFNHVFQRFKAQFRQRFAVVWREADHPTGAAGALAAHQRIVTLRCVRGVGHQGRKVVGKYVGTGVIRVGVAGHPGVARAQETVRIVGRQGLFCRRFLRPLPGALGAMRRNQNPLSG